MANPFVWGACPIYFNSVANNPASSTFVGHTEENGPNVEIFGEYENMMCSLAGSRVPFDKAYEGSRATISMSLTRWNQGPINSISQFANGAVNLGNSGAGAAPGYDPPGEIGTLMQTEGQALSIFLLAPYTAKSFFAAQLPGMRFLCCNLVSMRMGPLGPKPRILTLTFEAWPYFDLSVTNTFGTGAFKLWDTNVAGLPAIN